MIGEASGQWFLRKNEDGTIFGPLSIAQLVRWASSAQVAPNDSVSPDSATWLKAPMLPELRMDWIVEITSERAYGPTTLGAMGEFFRLGEISETTVVINACDGSRHQICDIAAVLQPPSASVEDEAAIAAGPAIHAIAVDVHERIRELEQALREERRALAGMEARYRQLEAAGRRAQIGVITGE